MAGQFLLLNPRARKRRASPKRKTTARRRKTYRRNPTVNVFKGARRPARRKTAARRSTRRTYRRNPIGRAFKPSVIMGAVKDAAIGGAGAIGVDLLMGQAARFLPANMQLRITAEGKVNPLYYVAKAGIAILVGALGGKLVGNNVARQIAAGSLTVQAYEVARSFIPASSTLPLGYPGNARIANRRINGMGEYVRGMGEYVQGAPRLRGVGRGQSVSNPASRAKAREAFVH